MKPLRLILTDWCQHVSRDIVFSEGLNAIMGANGSGKTNILEALNLCLSLDTNNPGKKTDSIRNGCERASVVLVFEHQDIEGRITAKLSRNYRTSWDELSTEIEHARRAVEANAADPSFPVTDEQLQLQSFKPVERVKFTLEWADVTCRNATEVGEFIRSHTLLDPKTVRTNYFPRQGDVDGAMSADKDVRLRVFHEKAGTAMCQKIWDELGKAQRAIPDFSLAEQAVQDTRARLSLARSEHMQASKLQADLMEQQIDSEGPQDIVRRYNTAQANKQQLAHVQQQLHDLSAKTEHALQAVNQATADGTACRELFDELELHAADWGRQVWEYQQAQQQQQRLTELRRAATEAVKELEAMPVCPTAETSLNRITELREQSATLRQRADQLDQWLQTFASGTCPTCGQSIGEQVLHRHQQERQQLSDPGVLVAQAAQLEQQYNDEQQAVSNWHQQRQRLEQSISSLNEQLANTPEPQLADVTSAQSGLERHRQTKAELDRLRTLHAQLLSAYQQHKSAYDLAFQNAQHLMSVDGQECPTDEEFHAAEASVAAAHTARQQLNEATTEVQVLERRVQDLENEERERSAAAAKVEPARVWSTMLGQARDLLHKNELPLQVIAWYADQLAAHTQKGLDNFDAGYQLAVSPDLDLLGVFPDKVMSSSRFSGGEKNMTNICMRLGMHSLFPSDLRLLVLDEVEVHLDQDKVARLPVILETVKNMARERGLVVLFISHHPSLVGISDRTIRID